MVTSFQSQESSTTTNNFKTSWPRWPTQIDEVHVCTQNDVSMEINTREKLVLSSQNIATNISYQEIDFLAWSQWASCFDHGVLRLHLYWQIRPILPGWVQKCRGNIFSHSQDFCCFRSAFLSPSCLVTILSTLSLPNCAMDLNCRAGMFGSMSWKIPVWPWREGRGTGEYSYRHRWVISPKCSEDNV